MRCRMLNGVPRIRKNGWGATIRICHPLPVNEPRRGCTLHDAAPRELVRLRCGSFMSGFASDVEYAPVDGPQARTVIFSLAALPMIGMPKTGSACPESGPNTSQSIKWQVTPAMSSLKPIGPGVSGYDSRRPGTAEGMKAPEVDCARRRRHDYGHDLTQERTCSCRRAARLEDARRDLHQ